MLTKEQRKQALDAYEAYCSDQAYRSEIALVTRPLEYSWLACWELAIQAATVGVRVVPEHLRKWCERYATEELRGALRGLCTPPPSREEISKLVSFVLNVADGPGSTHREIKDKLESEAQKIERGEQ